MFSADELKSLRSKLSDDQILEGVRKHGNVPDLDIDRLKKSGLSSSSILDGLSKHYTPSKQEPADAIDNAMDAGGTILGGLQQGAASALTGAGESAKQLLGEGNISEGLKYAGDVIAPADYKSSKDDWKQGNYLKSVGKGVVESLPGLGTDIAAGGLGTLVGGPVGGAIGFGLSNMARSWGSTAKQIAQERSGDANAEPDFEQKVAAAPISLAEAALAKLGLKYGLGTPTKGAGLAAVSQIPGQIGRGVVGDAATSAVSDIVNQSGVKLAAGKNPLDIDPSDLAHSIATGAATGGALRSTKAISDINNAIKFRQTVENPEAASRFADRLGKEDLSDPTKAFEAMKVTRASIETDIATSSKDLQKYFNDKRTETNNDSPDEGSVKKLISEIRSGKVVSKPVFDEIRQRLSDSGKHGEELIRHVEELNEHNRLSKMATSSEQSGRFAGGLSGHDAVETYLNPLGKLGKISAAAMGGASVIPGIGGLGALGAVGTSLSTVLPTVVGAQGGSYAALRGIDKLMGNRNPAKEFADRISNTADTAPNTKPTYEASKAKARQDEQMALRDRELTAQLAMSEANASKQAEAQAIREARQKESQTDAAWRENEKLKAAEERRKAEQDALFDKGKLTPDEIARQKEAMWAKKSAEDSYGVTTPELPSDLAVARALEGFRRNNLTTMVARANTQARRQERAARQADREAKAEQDAQAKAEAALAREQAKSHKETLAETKARIGLMFRSKAKANLADAAEAKLKSAEDRANTADMNATLSAFRKSQKIKSNTLKAEEKAKTAEEKQASADLNSTLSSYKQSQKIKSNSIASEMSDTKTRIGVLLKSKAAENKANSLADKAEQTLKDRDIRQKNADTNATLSAFRLSQKIKSNTLKVQARADKAEKALKAKTDQANNADMNATLSAFRQSQRIKNNTLKLSSPRSPKEAQPRSTQDFGESFHYKGHDYAIPEKVDNRAGYIQSVKNKVDILSRKLEAKSLNLSDETRSVLKAYEHDLRSARNEETMRGLVKDMLKHVSPQDAKVLGKYHFDETFWKTQFGKANKD